LEGAFNKIVAYSKLNNVDFTLENAQEALKDIINSDKPKKITPDLVIEKVAEYYGVSRDDIISKKERCKNITTSSGSNVSYTPDDRLYPYRYREYTKKRSLDGYARYRHCKRTC
jgi:hypothetical protein